tara:strand:- start:107761 stop:109686 length:1926 start_codon:yes stop_codon:yes gene_type:complete
MKETTFIKQNQKKWAQFERNKNNASSDPEKLGELYSEINNDLSYAQTFYKKRTVRAYLNHLAQDAHRRLYKQKKEPFGTVWKAWTVDIPLEIYRARKNILFALILFLIYATIGAFSTYQDIDFAKSILGGRYIQITEENIANGDPLGIYGSGSQGSMFIDITINNIQVALMAFFGGILFSLGTHVILFNNAIMVGVFQYFFKMKGLLLTSFLTIWIHGAFEISAIVIASGAGFTLGHGLLFPGSYTRLQALQMSGMRGIRIMLSLVPIFIIAGFLESYVTRHYQTLPDWSKWLIVLFSFSLILFYYLVYPILVARKYPHKVNENPEVSPLKNKKFDLHLIRKNADTLRDSFQFYRIKFPLFWKLNLKFVVPLILLIAIYQNYTHWDDLNTFYYFDWASQMSILFGNIYSGTYNGTSDLIISFAWIIPLSVYACIIFYSFNKEPKEHLDRDFIGFLKNRLWKVVLGAIPFYLIMMFVPFYIQLPLIFIAPFFFILPASLGLNNTKKAVSEGFDFASKHWTKGFVTLLVLCLSVFFLSQPFAFVLSIQEGSGEPPMNDLLDWFCNFLQPILLEYTSYHTEIVNLFRQLIYLLFFLLIIPLFFIVSGFIFYTAREEVNATGLYKAFEKFGKRSKTQETKADFDE